MKTLPATIHDMLNSHEWHMFISDKLGNDLTKDSIGETVRGFEVHVLKPNGKPRFKYPARHAPYLTGEQATACMAELKKRGHTSLALTDGLGGEEVLTLDEMQELYA